MTAPREPATVPVPMTPEPSRKAEHILISVIWIAALAFLIGGAFTLRPGLETIRKARASTAWPQTEAQVTYAKSEFHDGGTTGDSTYQPVVKYRYVVEGVAYEGQTVFYGNDTFSKRSGKRKSQETISRYANHPLVNVHYDPARPSESVLEPGATLRTYDTIGWACVLLALGAILAVWGLRCFFPPRAVTPKAP